MSLLSKARIAKYTKLIDSMIENISNNQINFPNLRLESDKLMETLIELKQELNSYSLEQWFKKWLETYKFYFFNPVIDKFTNPIKESYISIWMDLQISEKVKVAKYTQEMYETINIKVVTKYNFKLLIFKQFESFIKPFTSINKYACDLISNPSTKIEVIVIKSNINEDDNYTLTCTIEPSHITVNYKDNTSLENTEILITSLLRVIIGA